MEQRFVNIRDSKPYYAFKNNISNIASFLPLGTMTHFTALSKFFNNILNNSKSSFGRNFWKYYAIKNKSIKKYKGNINYQFKIVYEKVKQMKRVINTTNHYFSPFCDNCDKTAYPDEFSWWVWQHQPDYVCNCKIVKCQTKREFLESKNDQKIFDLEFKRNALINELKYTESKLKVAYDKKEELSNAPSYKIFIPILENLKETAHYKTTRSQSQKLLLEVKSLSAQENRERPNINYKISIDRDRYTNLMNDSDSSSDTDDSSDTDYETDDTDYETDDNDDIMPALAPPSDEEEEPIDVIIDILHDIN